MAMHREWRPRDAGFDFGRRDERDYERDYERRDDLASLRRELHELHVGLSAAHAEISRLRGRLEAQ